jgi:hypothetical protein
VINRAKIGNSASCRNGTRPFKGSAEALAGGLGGAMDKGGVALQRDHPARRRSVLFFGLRHSSADE